MIRRRRTTITDRPEPVDAHTSEYVDEHAETVHEGDTVVSEARGWWSPAQLVALIIGLGFLVIGAIAQARAGLGGANTHVIVAGIHQTQLLAIVHIVYGALMTAAGAVPGGARGLMTLLGAIALAFGIVLLVQPANLHTYLGTHQPHGFLYLITGALSILAGVLSPVAGGRRTHVSRRSHRD